MGIGTATPAVLLDVEGGTNSPAFKLVDGTQAAGNVLTSDANGNASWHAPAPVSSQIVSRTGANGLFASDSLIYSLSTDSIDVYYNPATMLVTLICNAVGGNYYDVSMTGVLGGVSAPVTLTGTPAGGQMVTLNLSSAAYSIFGVMVSANRQQGGHGFTLNLTIYQDINCFVNGIANYY